MRIANTIQRSQEMSYRNIAIIGILFFALTGISSAQKSISDLREALSQNPHDKEILLNLGIAYHNEGVSGDKDAVKKGFACLDTLLALDPTNAVALAYRGSLWTLRGRDAWWPFTRMSDVDRGIDEMDKAVDLAPDNVTVRLTRGINSVHLPSMFKRIGTAEKDFYYLVNMPSFQKLDPGLRSTIYYWSGMAYKQDDQTDKAKEFFKKAVETAPGSENANNASQELKNF